MRGEMGGGGGGGGGALVETMYNKITFMFIKEYHGNILSMHLIKFRKSEKWKKYIYIFNKFKVLIAADMLSVVLFYKTKQLTLFSSLWLS